jgi:protein-L-isoaspartate(D-aspartate) O-methyltransferase
MPHDETSFEESRQHMVDRQLAQRGITDERVLAAMRQVPRHRFVPEDMWDMAYRDTPLPIGQGQTISQPYIVAYMTQMLHLSPEDRVLEIGTGSGYQVAILGRLAKQVYTVERVEELARRAEQILKEMGYDTIHFRIGDGGYGWPEAAPFDAIVVTAAAPEVPQPLVAQLADGGRLIAPVGPIGYQDLVRLHRRGEHVERETLVPVAFVPLVGEHGWREPGSNEEVP